VFTRQIWDVSEADSFRFVLKGKGLLLTSVKEHDHARLLTQLRERSSVFTSDGRFHQEPEPLLNFRNGDER
jgi:hypothetical protein